MLAIGLFFGSRYFNRYRASREVRSGMITELSKKLGDKRAAEMVDKIHWPCFEPNYQMSFRRRGGSSTFDEDKYASCAIEALQHEIGEMNQATSNRSQPLNGSAGREAPTMYWWRWPFSGDTTRSEV